MREQRQISELTGHIILYAKHWYKKTDNPFEDLAQFMWGWSGTPAEYYGDNYIYQIVLEAFTESCTHYEVYNCLKDIFWRPFEQVHFTNTITQEYIVKAMLGTMGALKVLNDDNSKILDLPEPNPKYLPFPDNPDNLAYSEQANKDGDSAEKGN